MAIVVDTNILSYFLKRDSRAAIYQPHLASQLRFISFMTLAELRFWAINKNWAEKRRKNFEEYVSENYGIVYADDELCKIWAEIKSEAFKKGRSIETADAWVASVALMFDIPLVTHNRKHFENITNLKIISEN